MTVQEIKDKLREVRNKQKQFLNERETLNAEDEEQFQRYEDEEKKLQKELEIAEKEEAAEAATANALENDQGNTQNKSNDEIYRKEVFPKLLTNQALNSDEKNVLEEVHQRQMGTSTDSAGGYLVPQELQDQIIQEMSWYGGMREFASVNRSSNGRKLEWPKNTENKKGAIVGENPASDVSQDNPTTSNVTIDFYTYHSYEIVVSRQLLQDSAFNLERFIERKVAERIGRILNEHFTTGDGSSKPYGVVTEATAGKTGANTSSITRKEIIDLVHSVDRDYRQSALFMMNDNTLADLKKLEVGSSDARPLWVPSMREGEPDRLEGYQYVINNEMSDQGTSNKPILFGDGGQYMIFDVTGTGEIQQLNELHALKYQIGWVMFSRHGGRLLDTEAVKYFQNAAS